MSKKNWLFLLLTAVTMSIVLPPMLDLLQNAKQSQYYSHIPLILVVSTYLIFRRRREMFGGAASFHPVGVFMIFAGVGLYLAGLLKEMGLAERAMISTLAGLALWWGSYIVLYGKGCSRRAHFPFAFLFFAVPVPAVVMERIIDTLVIGSIYMTRLLFEAFGVPLVQEGAVFYLPGFNIEVAQECSGIRSSLALFITTILAGHMFLRKFWKQTLLALAVLPVAIFKNAVRIVTLYLLSYFVDMRIIEGGFLHRSGGFIFFGLGLLVLGLILWILRGLGQFSENA